MKTQISENIRDLRKQRGMMQEQLAEALGVSIGAVSKWERGAAVPDLSYIVEMADLFGVSVDSLVGYRVRSGAARDLEQRIHDLQRAKDFEGAIAEAEKALVRYPNDFSIVYRCAEVYQLKGITDYDERAVERAVALFERAVLLLPQNTDPEISEFSIQAEIAQCYIALDKKDEGVELLKRHNVGGIHNAFIGMTYVLSEKHDPEEAAPFLMKAFGKCLQDLTRTMIGYANYYVRRNEHRLALEATRWLAEFLDAVKEDGGAVTFVDKFRAALYAECACLLEKLGEREKVEPYLCKALKIARAFDANPVYHMAGMKFCIGEIPNATAYDDLGATAMEAIESQRLDLEKWDEYIGSLWDRLKEEET